MPSNASQSRLADARETSVGTRTTATRRVAAAASSLPQIARALQRSVGNRATGALVRSAVQRNGKGKKEAPQEQVWKEKIAEFGFGSVDVAGGGTKDADIKAKDDERLWLFEVKGANEWQSASNVAHTGNVPAKQLAGKISGNLDQTLSAPKLGVAEQKESMTVKDYILGAEAGEHARDQLLLGASKMDIDDAILAIKYDASSDDFDFTKGQSIPLSINSVLRYLDKVADLIPDFAQRQNYKQNHVADVAKIREAWTGFPRDGRAFFVANPEFLTRLEAAYSALRRTTIIHAIGTTQLAQIGDDIEYKFLPVVRELTHVEKPETVQMQRQTRVDSGREVTDRLRGSVAGVEVYEGLRSLQYGAMAYTQGHELHFAPGTYDPSSTEGRQLLGHELTHVLQQRDGRAAGQNGSVLTDATLEAEADGQSGQLAERAPVAANAALFRPEVPVSTAPIQLRKFKNVAEAEQFLRTRLTGPLAEDATWDAFDQMMQGTDLLVDQNSNYNLLVQAYNNLAAQLDINDLVASRNAVKRRTVSQDIWTHIAKGEVKKDTVVGYHWKGLGDEALAIATGGAYNADAFGCYKQKVKDRESQKITKKTDSSFYPDDWTEQDVRMAIEYAFQAVSTKQEYQVTLPDKGRGLILFFNGDSYFPFI